VSFQSPVTIQVLVPNSDKSEWKLNGQMIAVTMALSEPITNLKTKLQDETGMPPAKQKIFYEVNYTIGFKKYNYNTANSSGNVLQRQQYHGLLQSCERNHSAFTGQGAWRSQEVVGSNNNAIPDTIRNAPYVEIYLYMVFRINL